MVYDFQEGYFLTQIGELEKDIKTTKEAISYMRVNCQNLDLDLIHDLEAMVARDDREKERLEIKLQIHRQQRKESGVKY